MIDNAKPSLTLRVLPHRYGIVRLAQDASVPDWVNGSGLSAMIRADDELTLVCQQDRIPAHVNSVINWRCFRSVGPFAFNASGIVLSIIAPLSNRGIGVFVVCTFDGEHVLVADAQWEESLQRLKEAGHRIID
jgi:uncharacterized protein